MTDLTVSERVLLLEENRVTVWRRLDETRKEIRDHHTEDDTRFAELSKEIKAIGIRFDQILAGIVVACVLLAINAGFLWLK